MSRKPPSEKPFSDLDVFVDEGDLPPLAGDDVADPDSSLPEDYFDLYEEESGEDKQLDGESMEDDEGFLPEMDDFVKEESWLDDGALGNPGLEISSVDEEESDWSVNSDETKGEVGDDIMDEGWFSDVEETVSEVDGGQNGPEGDDVFEIDETTWDVIGEISSDDVESPEEAMRRLGIALSEDVLDEEPLVDGMNETAPEATFMGPCSGSVEEVVVLRDRVVAVGEGIYSIAADGLFHRLDLNVEVRGVSACASETKVFIGTVDQGAFCFDSVTRETSRINGWCHLGMKDEVRAEGGFSSCTVDGQLVDGEYRLFLLTGRGELFVSTDAGQTWTSPLMPEFCLGVAPARDSRRVFVLLETNGQRELRWSDDVSSWIPVSLPEELMNRGEYGELRMASCQDTVLLYCPEADGPVWLTLDAKEPLARQSSVHGATAMLLCAETPGWIAAAVYNAARGISEIRVSVNGGNTWKTVLVVGRLEEPGPMSRRKASALVTSLVSGGSQDNYLYIVTLGGVHVIKMPLEELSH